MPSSSLNQRFSEQFVAEAALNALHTEMTRYVFETKRAEYAFYLNRTAEYLQQQADGAVVDYADGQDIDSGSDEEDDSAMANAMNEAKTSPAAVTGEGSRARAAEGVFEGAVQASAALAPHLTAPIVLRCMGHHAGLLLAERMLHREAFARFTPLEVTRFIGGQVWRLLFHKKVDKMRHLDNVYFTLVDLNFRWMRCAGGVGAAAVTTSAAVAGSPAASSGSPGGNSSSPASVTNQHLAPHFEVAAGFSAEGTVLDATASAREAQAAKEKALRGQPEQRDMLSYMQGVLSGVVEALLGPHHRALVTSSVTSGNGDGTDGAMFALDFRAKS